MQSPTQGITQVYYAGAFIESAKLRRGDSNGAAEEVLLSREKLLQTVKQYGPLATLHQRPNGNWDTLDRVDVVTVDGTPYLKWLNDGYACDDLGDVSIGTLS